MKLLVPIIFKTAIFAGRGWKKITRRCGSRTDQGKVSKVQTTVYYEGIHWPSVYLCTALSPTCIFDSKSCEPC